MTRQTFLQGALVLLIASLISRLLGFVPRFILPRMIGTEGIGLYQMAFPILTFFLTIARFGLNVSISQVVAAANAANDLPKIRKTLIISAFIVTILSILLTPVIISCALFLSEHFYTDARVIYPLLAITPIVPVIALATIIRGYFQGKHNMKPTAVSNVLETIVRVIAVIFLASYLLPYGLGMAAAGVMIGVGLGEVASLLYLFTHFRKARQQLAVSTIKHRLFAQLDSYKKTFRELWNISVPVTASGLIGSFSYAIEPILVAQSLAIAGISTQMSTALYGELSGLALFLVFFPTTLTYSLSVSLVPAVSEAHAQKNESLIRQRLNQSLRLTILMGIPFTIIFILFPTEISDVLFAAPQVGALLKLLAPFGLFLYAQSSLAAVLQGLNMAKTAFYNSLFGAIIKTSLILILGSRPELGIHGVIIAINVGMTLITLLHYFSVSKRIQLKLNWMNYVRIIVAALSMGIVGHLVFGALQQTLAVGIALLLTLIIAMLSYVVFLLVFRALTKQDLARLPWIGKHFR